MSSSTIIDEVTPDEAYRTLIEDKTARLVDVRTRAEWAFVGLPDTSATGADLWTVEWASFPSMAQNQDFTAQLEELSAGQMPARLFFICRSGARSMAAARTVAAAMESRGLAIHCTNVAEGFEGDLDSDMHRGIVSGWKARGLAWRQS